MTAGARRALPLALLVLGAGCHDRAATPRSDQAPAAAAREPGPPAVAESAVGTGARFVAEHVELTVADGMLAVDGRYTFAAPLSRRFRGRIGYPILVDDGQPRPDSVVVDAGESLPVKCREPTSCAAVLALELAAGENREVRIRYRQRLAGPRAGYLVTSALRWGQRLERAEFVVRVPAAWLGVALTLPADGEIVAGGQRVFSITRRDFAPARELVVTWQAQRAVTVPAPPPSRGSL